MVLCPMVWYGVVWLLCISTNPKLPDAVHTSLIQVHIQGAKSVLLLRTYSAVQTVQDRIGLSVLDDIVKHFIVTCVDTKYL